MIRIWTFEFDVIMKVNRVGSVAGNVGLVVWTAVFVDEVLTIAMVVHIGLNATLRHGARVEFVVHDGFVVI